MSDIKLGPSGSQTTLPMILWPSGAPPGLPVDVPDPSDEATMLDGSVRYNQKTNAPRQWTFPWDGINATDFSTLMGVKALRGTLLYTNDYTGESANVVIGPCSYGVKPETVAGTAKYVFSLTIKEVL